MPPPRTFTPRQKMFCARREVRQRQRVYPRLVDAGKMSRADADRELACMEAIAADYELMERQEAANADLFGEGSRP